MAGSTLYKDNQEAAAAQASEGGAAAAPELPPDHPFRSRQQYPVREDAFATLMQWLHGRIEETR